MDVGHQRISSVVTVTSRFRRVSGIGQGRTVSVHSSDRHPVRRIKIHWREIYPANCLANAIASIIPVKQLCEIDCRNDSRITSANGKLLRRMWLLPNRSSLFLSRPRVTFPAGFAHNQFMTRRSSLDSSAKCCEDAVSGNTCSSS